MCLDTQLTIGDLETYIKVQLDDPRYHSIDTDPILDIIIHAQRRLDKGDFMPRVVSEAMVSLDEYLLETTSYETSDRTNRLISKTRPLSRSSICRYGQEVFLYP